MSTQKLWQKKQTLNSAVEQFETAVDLECDQILLPYDLLGSLAHIKGLNKIGILTDTELKKLTIGLQQLWHQYENNQLKLQSGDEDMHTKIENELTKQLGPIGKKLHTGRSRNDQVLTALRLYSKNELLKIWEQSIELTSGLLDFAKEYETILMPGYTHMQKAMPSSVGLWASSFAEGLIDDLKLLESVYQLSSQSPLGSAAGYGVPLPLDREYTAQLMGFEKVQINSLYCQNSRGKIEAAIISVLISLLLEVNKLSSDILLFTTSEFDFFSVSPDLYSGSSIMPQKKNVDIAELLRSKVHLLLGSYVQLISLSSNLPSGYNRDLQDSKKILIDSFVITKQSLEITTLLVKNVQVKSSNTSAAITAEMLSTHYALDLVKKGIPFRSAYLEVAKKLEQNKINVKSKEELFSSYTHSGSINNLQLNAYRRSLKKSNLSWCQHQSQHQDFINQLNSSKKD